MTLERLLIFAGALVLVSVAMLSMHERHYRDRRQLIGGARYEGIEKRVVALENIIAEERTA